MGLLPFTLETNAWPIGAEIDWLQQTSNNSAYEFLSRSQQWRREATGGTSVQIEETQSNIRNKITFDITIKPLIF